MRKIFFTILLCGLLTFAGTATAMDVGTPGEMSGAPWIKIDPLPFFTADVDNFTFSGTTSITAGESVLVEVINTNATLCGGPAYGRSDIVTVQNGTDGVQTWTHSINSTTYMPPMEYEIIVNGIETSCKARERFTIYPENYVPTTRTPPPEETQSPGFAFAATILAAAAVILRKK